MRKPLYNIGMKIRNPNLKNWTGFIYAAPRFMPRFIKNTNKWIYPVDYLRLDGTRIKIDTSEQYLFPEYIEDGPVIYAI